MDNSKTKKPSTALVIMERDLEVLKFIGNGGIASESQIHAKYWSGAKEQTCRERLEKLKKAGLLKSEITNVRDLKGERIFSLQPEAYKLFSRAIQDRFFNKITNSEKKQQLLAQEALLKLEQEWAEQGKVLMDWKHEREIKGALKKQQRGTD